MYAVLEKPEMAPLKVGAQFKTFTVTGKKGMEMPNHLSTQEAVVVIQKGSALLKIENTELILEEGSTHIIPAGKPHSLLLLTDFKAVALMALSSNIEFLKN